MDQINKQFVNDFNEWEIVITHVFLRLFCLCFCIVDGAGCFLGNDCGIVAAKRRRFSPAALFVLEVEQVLLLMNVAKLDLLVPRFSTVTPLDHTSMMLLSFEVSVKSIAANCAYPGSSVT